MSAAHRTPGSTCPCTISRGELRAQVAERFGLDPRRAIWEVIQAWYRVHGVRFLPMSFNDTQADAIWDEI